MAHMDNMIHLASGGLGSGVGLLVTYPLDLVRIRLQSQKGIKGQSYTINSYIAEKPINTTTNNKILSSPLTNNLLIKIPKITIANKLPVVTNVYKQLADLHLIKNVKEIVIKEGIKGLYKGLGASVISYIPSKAAYFYCYNGIKTELNTGNYYVKPHSAPVHMFSAAFSALSVCAMLNPIHVMKTRLQLNNGTMNVRECIQYTYQHNGIRGFFRGFQASAYGVSEVAIQFMLYEKIVHNLHFWLSKYNTPFCWISEDPKVAHYMIAGMLSKFTAVIITYPHEVIKTRTREVGYKGQSFWQFIFQITQQEGFKALYRGMGITLIRSVPNSAIALTAYEYFVKLFNRILID
uniref:Mitochondrial carrier protein n=1 Tax=Parastrongyloides trichosuri TaxID=131310 RepID=A0A0N4ZD21_PARTI